MPDGSDSLTLTAHPGIAAFTASEWDACAGADNPFVSHAFLSALEDSRSACAAAGWAPQHLGLREASGRLLACAPLYLKSHSYGEYVFDWSWARAYEQAGGRYYPKLQCAVPFTPVTGPRLLVPPGPDAESLRRTLAAGMVQVARRHGVSSLHVTFPTQDEAEVLAGQGFLTRIGTQYHWRNQGYASFDDFLATLSSRKRKAIRKERERANGQGVTFRTLSGADIKPAHWDAFFRFYMATADRKWGNPYLEREFFTLLGERLGDRVVLVLGEADGRPVCGALNLRGGDALYGRNWGALGDFRFLHFEACYYRAIDHAIAHGLTWVEAGAQGEHKVSRGYLPRATWSAHWIADPGFRAAVDRFLVDERALVEQDMDAVAEMGPYRKEGG
ncbi:GNAT family N-acetyltransferase [Novispirillum sp. DQ9]|uniref:GNAT family N-acetyltransferase n=1 Tax=Novispirillum sp. DQ9 TaxID=3398612 RepID=UPI003C7B112E